MPKCSRVSAIWIGLYCGHLIVGVRFTSAGFAADDRMRLHVLAVAPYNVEAQYDWVRASSGFALGVEDVHRQFPNVNITVEYLFDGVRGGCDEFAAENANLINEYYYRRADHDDCFAVCVTTCADFTGVSSLAYAHDWPVLITSPTQFDYFAPPDDFHNGQIAMAGTTFGYAAAVLGFMKHFDWRHAAIIYERQSVVRHVQAVYEVFTSIFLTIIRETASNVQLKPHGLDGDSDGELDAALTAAKQASRVMILLATGVTAVKIMKRAKEVDMANGEYVFINLQTIQTPFTATVGQFSYAANDLTLDVFRSFFFFTFNPKRSTGTSSLATSPYITGAGSATNYGALMLLATQLNESAHAAGDRANHSRCPANGVTQGVKSRNLKTKYFEGYVSDRGIINLDVEIYGFNLSTRMLQAIGAYEWNPTGHFVWDPQRSIDWPTKDGQPPPDVPVCGYSGVEGPCTSKALTISIILVAGLLVFAGTLLFLRQLRRSIRDHRDWRWMLMREDLRSGP